MTGGGMVKFNSMKQQVFGMKALKDRYKDYPGTSPDIFVNLCLINAGKHGNFKKRMII
jgi:hypothetical protein